MSEITNWGDQTAEEAAAAAALTGQPTPVFTPRVDPPAANPPVQPRQGSDAGAPLDVPAPAAPPAPAPAVPDDTASTAAANILEQNKILFRILSQRLTQIGLSSLFTYDPVTDTFGGKLWDWVQTGAATHDRAVLDALVEATPEYQARFPAVFAQRAQVAAGHAVHVMTTEEVLAYEDTVKGLMQRAGFPGQFYDTPQSIQSLAAQDISALEVDQRIREGWSVIHTAPVEIRDEFTNYFGVQGDAALAMWYLDPTHTVDNLDRMTRAASLGGIGLNYNVNLDRVQAEDLARAAISNAQAQQGFGDIAREKPLFDEQIHELDNLTPETTGVAATFGTPGSAAAQRALEQRRGNRAAAFANQGGAAADQRGVLGLTEANQ